MLSMHETPGSPPALQMMSPTSKKKIQNLPVVLSTCRERCSASSLGLRGFWGPWPYLASNHFISLTAQPHWILVCRTSHTCTSGQSNQLCLLIDTCERGLVRLGILKNEDDPYTAGAAMPEATPLQVSLELTSYNI